MAATLIALTEEIDELELRDRCVRGERGAQLFLFRKHKKRVHAILYRILGSNQEMEDLVQDTFLEVFRGLHTFKGNAQLGTWISRICSRVAFAYIKKRKPKPEPIDATKQLRSPHQSTDEIVDSRNATIQLYVALSKIEAKQRIAFALHVIDGQSMQSVAEITESSLVATKSRVLRARKRLAKLATHDPYLASYLSEKEPLS